MNYRAFIIILSLLFQLIRVAYSQTIDPYCHVEVVSGSPAMFNLSTIDDITQGKTLAYTSRLRVFFFKAPESWKFCVKSNAENFDGPSADMSVQNISINVEAVYFGNLSIAPGDFDAYSWNVKSNIKLSASGTDLAEGLVKKNQFGSRYQMDFIVRFSIEPSDASPLSDKSPGYYASQACFYVQADYFK